MTTTTQLRQRIDDLADDIGRLRRRAEPGSSLEHTVSRIAAHTETLHLLTHPSAGELVAWYAPADPVAVDQAIAIVDARWARLQTRLGKTPA